MSNPPLNPPSFRFPFNLPDDTHPEVKRALETTYSGFVVHEQAFKAIKDQVDATKTAVTAVASSTATSVSSGVTSFNTLAGNVTYFPNLGTVNDQIGNTAYTTQGTDNGANIIVGDSSPIFITLDPSVSLPWFTIIDNDSSSVATLVPGTGILHGETNIPGGGFGIVFFDGTDWWCGAVKLANVDGVSIGVTGGVIRTIGIDSTIGPGATLIVRKGLIVGTM